MKTCVLGLLAGVLLTSLCLAQVTPGEPQTNGLIPRTISFDVNTNLNNTATESTGVGIAANGNVIIGWEDDRTTDEDIRFFGAVWSVFGTNGTQLNPVLSVTNTPHPPSGYDTPQSMTTFYRAFFRADGTPTPGNAARGPKIKTNPFGNGMGMGASAYYLGFEVPALFDINLDAGGGGDFPAVQLLNNDGTPDGIVTIGDTAAEPSGDIYIADWEYLSNGNVVIVGESRQAADRALTGQTGGNVPVFRIVTPAGVEVKGYTAVSALPLAGGIWHGVAVTAKGFAVRFDQGGATVRMFDNAGNPTTTNISLTNLTGNVAAGGGGRGDGAGFHGNGTDAYVHIASGGGTPVITVLNANGTLRWSRKVADQGATDPSSDRVDAAIAPDGRVLAVWDDNRVWIGGITNRLPQARMFGPAGNPIGNIFWISERDQAGTVTVNCQRPRVAWRGKQVAIVWESLNSPATFNQVVSARLFDVQPIGSPEINGLAPRTISFDVNTNLNNTATESTGVAIAGNGNIMIGWEDDGTTDEDIRFFGAVWSIFSTNGTQLNPVVTITNTPGPPPYDASQGMNTFYRAFFRSNGTPTPGNTAWGPKIKANRFGNGIGLGASAYYLGREVPELAAINLDTAGPDDDFPAVQLLNDNGTPNGIVTVTDADAEPGGDIRIADWEYLSNGNIAIVGESRQVADRALTGQTGGNVPVYRIVTPAGVQVKAYSAVSAEAAAGDIWHGVGVTANGFAVRFTQGVLTRVRMFDNAGNPTTTNINLATLTGTNAAAAGGRGDGIGFHGNGTDAYVYIATAGSGPWVTVLNANGTLRWSRRVADEFETIASDRVDAAISPDGRVIAVFDENRVWTTGFTNRLPQARLFSAAGVPIGSRFWISERDFAAPGGPITVDCQRPRVAWRDNCVAVIWESLNSPATFNRVVSARIFNLPSILASIRSSGTNITMSWSGGGPTWSVSKRSTIRGAVTTIATGLTGNSFTAPRTGTEGYFQISSP